MKIIKFRLLDQSASVYVNLEEVASVKDVMPYPHSSHFGEITLKCGNKFIVDDDAKTVTDKLISAMDV